MENELEGAPKRARRAAKAAGPLLTARQQRFVDEYLIDLNGKQAAIRAGYSPKGAEVTASRLLRRAKVPEEIARRRAELAQESRVSANQVIHELALIAFSNMLDYVRLTPGGEPYVDLSRLSPEQAAALQVVTIDDYVEGRGSSARLVKRVRIRLADKRAALVALGKHLDVFGERVAHAGLRGRPIPAEQVPLPKRDYEELRRGILERRTVQRGSVETGPSGE